VLSRGFVRRALEIPLGDLESEIKWLYITDGRLAKVIQNAHTLIQKSRDSSSDSDDADAAIPRLTAGGAIALGRTLSRLEAIVQQPQ
jgi:ubiquitin-conjugating enzyme E2 O